MNKPTPSEQFWRGISTGYLYDVQDAIQNGADINEAVPEGVQYRGDARTRYQPRKVPVGISAFEALMLCHETWGSDPTSAAEFRKTCGLLIRGSDKDVFTKPMSNGDTALLTYCRLPEIYQKSSIFELVLRRTPKRMLDAQDDRGYTGLMYLIQRYRMESFNALLKAGADANVRNNDGRNCALVAGATHRSSHRSYGKPESFLARAVEAGARIDVADNVGNTLPLIMHNYPLASFIAAGGDINAPNNEGITIAKKALGDRHFLRFDEMLTLDAIDWRKQIPDPAEFLQELNRQAALFDNTTKSIVRRLTVHLEAIALEEMTPSIHTQEKRSSPRL
jgi:hypothetical protein